MATPSRLVATSAAGALIASVLTLTLTGAPTASAVPVAAAGPSYHATITRADILLTARAQRSRYLGPDGHFDDLTSMNGTNLQVDALVTDLHNRKVVEGLLASPKAGPGAQARAMVDGYAAGVNKYLNSIGGSAGITDPECHGAAYI